MILTEGKPICWQGVSGPVLIPSTARSIKTWTSPSLNQAQISISLGFYKRQGQPGTKADMRNILLKSVPKVISEDICLKSINSTLYNHFNCSNIITWYDGGQGKLIFQSLSKFSTYNRTGTINICIKLYTLLSCSNIKSKYVNVPFKFTFNCLNNKSPFIMATLFFRIESYCYCWQLKILSQHDYKN